MDSALVLDALGTRWWISSPRPLPEKKIRTAVFDFQNQYSRFDPESDLSRLNNTKFFEQPSSEFLAMLSYGIRLFKETDGLFNMSVGARLEQDGYGRTSDPAARISTDLAADIEIGVNVVTIAQHVRLDFGGFGKGWLVDKIGSLLRDSGIFQFIINGGGDILVGDLSEILYLEHPLEPGEQIGQVSVRNGALASSSKLKRAWTTAEGALKSHIISPIESPSDNPLSVHVRAPTALQADTFGTVFLLADRQKRRQLAEKQGLEFMEVGQDLRFWQTPGLGFTPNS